MIFHSFSSSLSIRDELVESSSDSCNILPETVTIMSFLFPTFVETSGCGLFISIVEL
jgi:hypothetical protein